MRERAREMNAAARRRAAGGSEDGEREVLEKISSFTEADRALARRIHQLIRSTAPDLVPRLWYGMPAYANRAGDVVCHFQNAGKFKLRYSTIGFSDEAKLDEGRMWPVVYALTELTPADEARLVELVKRAVS